jgi:flagellar biosynthetic protein FlhB
MIYSNLKTLYQWNNSTYYHNLSAKKHSFSYNLQFFAKDGPGGEKTEAPTPKKLTDARKEGQVAKSIELVTAASLIALFYTIKLFIGFIGNSFFETFNLVYGNIDKLSGEEFNTITATLLLRESIWTILKICLPLFIAAFIVSFVVDLAQVKWTVSGKLLKPKFSKINPIKGFSRIFSKDKVVELIKSVLKILVIVYMAYDALKDYSSTLLKLYEIELGQAVVLIGSIVIDLGLNISLMFLIIGLADYFYQKLKFKRDMMMTKQELKDEYKQTEGDPQIKSRIKNKMREASQRRMMQRLPEADVVITNPTHFAAAIKYDKDTAEAPVLLAKGADFLAERIKTVARENKIEIVENKPLARMLYYNVEIGNEIPPELYQMTAEVLAYVYSLKGGSHS